VPVIAFGWQINCSGIRHFSKSYKAMTGTIITQQDPEKNLFVIMKDGRIYKNALCE
jgi:hypothetical protein